MSRRGSGGGDAGGSQMALAGFAPPQALDRLFFAVFPDRAAAAAMSALAETLRRQHGLRARLHAPERLHVTVQHIDDYAGLPADVVADAIAAAGRLRLPAFDVRFDSVSSFAGRPGQHPLALLRAAPGAADADPLMRLQRELVRALQARMPLRRAHREFVPHVTLCYDAVQIAAAAVDPVTWRVDELVLVHSLLGRSEYRVLGRWPLDGGTRQDAATPTGPKPTGAGPA